MPEGPLAGRRLSDARRARNISLQDVARELHLDEYKVTALEQNRFDRLGAPVFVKGYLRKYAELVGLAAEDILADYRRFERSDETPPIVGLRRHARRGFPAGPWLGAVLVLALVTGGLWVWFSGGLDRWLPGEEGGVPAPRVANESASTRPQVADEPVVQEPGMPADAGSAVADSALPGDPGGDAAAAEPGPGEAAAAAEAVAAEELDAETVAPVLEAPESVPPPAGQVALQITFTGDCWTEVSDTAGDRLYFGLGRAGETVSVTGRAPLRVLLGNRANASLTVDGEDYPIPPSARRGDTARLTIRAR